MITEETRRFLFIGGIAHGNRVPVPKQSVLISASGTAEFPRVYNVTDSRVLEIQDLPEGVEGPGRLEPTATQSITDTYIRQQVTATLDNGDNITWSIYVHNTVQPSEDLLADLFENHWGLV